MSSHSSYTDEQFLPNLPIGLPRRNETQHLHRSLGKPIWILRSFGWLGLDLFLQGY